MARAVANQPSRTARRAGRLPVSSGGNAEFIPDYRYVRADLRHIALLAGSLLSLLVVLSFLVD